MYRILNPFFLTKSFDNLNSFFSKKIFKILKIFFVETNLTKLPDDNHILKKIDIRNEIDIIKKVKGEEFVPWTSQEDFPKLISDLQLSRNKILDVGAGSLSLFSFLEKKLKKIEYIYYDQPAFISMNKEIKKKLNLSNLKILENLEDLDENFDLVYFGSSLQYFDNYREILKKIFNKTRFILISLTPFFENPEKNNLVVKQINMHPTIYFHYIFNMDNFINLMKINNYILIKKNINSRIKFINFKNFNKDYKNLFMYDLMFERK